MKRIIKILTVVGCLILVCVSIPPLAEHFGDARRYATSFSLGESYDEINKNIPKRLVFRKLGKLEDTDISYAKIYAEQRNIDAEYVLIINNRFFPFTAPLGYALYFDENKNFVQYECSGL